MTGLACLFWIAVVTVAWIGCNLWCWAADQSISQGAGSAEQASPYDQ